MLSDGCRSNSALEQGLRAASSSQTSGGAATWSTKHCSPLHPPPPRHSPRCPRGREPGARPLPSSVLVANPHQVPGLGSLLCSDGCFLQGCLCLQNLCRWSGHGFGEEDTLHLLSEGKRSRLSRAISPHGHAVCLAGLLRFTLFRDHGALEPGGCVLGL